jgi:hypothetical protein
VTDTHYLPSAKKMIIILYRAVRYYTRSSVQSTVRFLKDRIPLDCVDTKMRIEWGKARYWWEKELKVADRQRLTIEYKFAANIR